MAGQKKDAQISILQRVIDRTPLRPARLDNFRPQVQSAAQFAARYFRENSIVQRLMTIGNEFSPLRRSIGSPIVDRYTNFNQSFGPIQRAMRPQPEHQPRHRREVEESYDADSFDYSPEPAYFEQPSPNYNQYSHEYASPVQSQVAPWEGPLNSTPLPVARRIEFQPANLKYLNNAEAPVRPANFSPNAVERVYTQPNSAVTPVTRTVAPVSPATQPFAAEAPETPPPSRTTQAAQPATPASPLSRTAQAPSPEIARTQAESSGFPEISAREIDSPESQAAQPVPVAPDQSQPAAEYSQPENNFAVPAQTQLQTAPSFENPAVARTTEYRPEVFEPAYEAAPLPAVQPALSRALQRTFDATTPQANPAGLNFARNAFQGTVQGASPASVARHFAAPATLARYRAVKKAADKVFLGEQSAFESAIPSFEPQSPAPSYQPPQPLTPVYAQPQIPVQRQVSQIEPEVDAAQSFSAELAEVRRVGEETREMLAAQQNSSPVPTAQPAQVQPQQLSQAQAAQPTQTRPETGQPETVRPEAAQVARSAEPGIDRNAPPRPASNSVQGESAAVESFVAQPGSVQPTPETAPNVAASEVAPVVRAPIPSTGETAQIGRTTITTPGEAAYIGQTRGEIYLPDAATSPLVSRMYQAAPAPELFDEAIPASLLDNGYAAEGYLPEVQRLTGNRLVAPLRTSGWANQLSSLKNNPGVDGANPATTTQFTRQLNLSDDNVETSVFNSWADTGAGVYYDRRQVRRVMSGESFDAGEAAYETQDRIYSLAEPNTGLASFQPQFMQALAAETVAPVQPPVNRIQATPAELPALQRTFTEPGGPANQPDRREINSSLAAPEFAAERPVTNQTQGNQTQPSAPQINQPLTPANQSESGQAATVARQTEGNQVEAAAELSQANPEENIARQKQGGQAQVFAADTFAETSGPSGGEFTQTGRGRRISPVSGSQPTALQRVFKRLDLEDAASPAFGENPGLDFGNLNLSYAAWPGIRPQRTQSAVQREIEAAEDYGFYEPEYSSPNFTARPYSEAAIESTQRPGAPETAQSFTGPAQAVPATEAPSATQEAAARLISPEYATDGGILPVGERGQSAQAEGVQGIQRTVSPANGEGVRPNQPQYFANSLETTWLSPENRLVIERLPGGSGALQRLMQAPGQLQAFLEGSVAASAANLNLPSLRNNPGLSGSVARSLQEGTAPAQNTFQVNNWQGGQPLNFILRRRVQRLVQDGPADFEGGYTPGEAFGFAQSLPNQFEIPNFNGQPQTGNGGNSLNMQPGSAPVQRTIAASQAGIQANVNRETASRIQRNAPSVPGQPNLAGNFTISTDWINQLQRKFEGMSVGKLSETTGQIMRYLNSGGGESANFAGFSTGPDFNYLVPPLLMRKVSDYTPQGDMPYSPPAFFEGQTRSSYATPGEVLRAYDEGATFNGLPDEGDAPVARQDGSARLDLPRLQQTHYLLQRLANLEKTNTSLELAHKMEAAAQANSDISSFARPSVSPLTLPSIRRPEIARTQENGPAQDDAGAAATEFTPPSSLQMTDVPLYRPGASDRFSNQDAGFYTDDDFARPAPETRIIEVRVPDHQNYATPLETAAARSSLNGPNIGQGEILQPLAIQRKASVAGPSQTATYAPLAQPSLHSILKTSVGRILDHPIQRTMSNVFGAQFNDVRVHTGNEAAQATREVGAEAFTLGSDIYFAPGRYQPHTQTGQALIGHELTHVMQQSSLPSLGNGRIPETSSQGQTLEHHAIANEHLLLRHLSGSHDDHNHGFSSDASGRLTFQQSLAGVSVSRSIERSYQPVSEQNNHQPVKQSHLRSDSGTVQRVADLNDLALNSNASSGSSGETEDPWEDPLKVERLANQVYQMIRDKIIVERDRGMGPGNNKFF